MAILEKKFTTTTKDKTPCIYAILNDNNFRVYVGESKTPMKRMYQHENTLKAGTHPNKQMQEDFNKGHTFTFIRLKPYTEDETETMRYYELKYMYLCRQKGIELYNCETDKEIERLLRSNSHDWEIYRTMERKRDEYYKKYFGNTYYQFVTWYNIDKQKGRNSFLEWKIKWFNETREKEIKAEEKAKRKKFLSKHKKVSFYMKKSIYEKLESITDNPEEYINKAVEKFIEGSV